MISMTLTEKIIARAADRESVRPGDEVWATADRMIMNDSSGPRRIAALIEELGGLWDKERVVLASDHFIPAANIRHAEIIKTTRQWAADTQIPNFYEGQGILHNLLFQEWLILPGLLLVGADSHTVSAGAVGAVAVAVGSTELATILTTGQVWLRVPETVRIELNNALPSLVDMRDVTMQMLGDLKADFALYRAVEFGGSFVDTLTIEKRLVLSNQGIEMGCKNAVVVPTQILLEEIAAAGIKQMAEILYPDTDATYEAVHTYDVSQLEPLVAAPHTVDNIVRATDLADTAIDVAYVGSCVGGRYEDLRAAAQIVSGKQVQVPLWVTPATHTIYRRCLEDGTLQTLVEAGALIQPAGCGACAGLHSGILAADETIITTATRNFKGRMGSRDSSVYLGSAYTVAASAVAGRVVDPREVGGEAGQ